TTDKLNFVPSGYYPSNGKSHQQYQSLDEQGRCYDKIIKSLNYVIIGEIKRC
ncbi:MAG: hypothetical protein JO104_06290, partial [Candidatus Eremiobacteraeota bacterium]|nr:hypothetical protein [Candidatus Eremiobacteraeota bacterium]